MFGMRANVAIALRQVGQRLDGYVHENPFDRADAPNPNKRETPVNVPGSRIAPSSFGRGQCGTPFARFALSDGPTPGGARMNLYLSRRMTLEPPEFLAGGGEMGAAIRAFNWAATPLGPPESWPQTLRTCLRIMLASRQPMWVWWGPDLINFYNDAYLPIIGGKHPGALGRPARDVWAEIWHQIRDRIAAAMQGEASYS